jgi:prepilin-type N-terminal cleavage/methylation domain-containing protein
MTRLRAQDGFTLVELLVTMLIMGIVMTATLTVFDSMQKQAKASSDRDEYQDRARRAVDIIATRLRGVVSAGTAAAIDRAGTNDLVFRVVDNRTPPQSGGSNTPKLMFVRFCVDTTTKKLYQQTLAWTTASPPALPSTACPGTGWQTPNLVAQDVSTAGGNIFSYSPDAANVARVGIDLSIDSAPTVEPPAARLQSSISLRNLNRPPSVVLSCVPVGLGQVICDSAGTADPDGQTVTYSWRYSTGVVSGGGTTCSGTTTAIGQGQPAINQAGLIGGTSYCFQLTASDPTNMSASVAQAVTAS